MTKDNNPVFSKIKSRNIIIITLIFLIFTVLFTFAQPLKYCSSCRILLMQEYISLNDPYAASKSAAYLSDIFAEVARSASFLDEVINSGFNIDKNYFKTNEQKKKKQWEKMINAKAINDMGILEIFIYHEDKNQAEQIANAASYILKTKHNLYHGAGTNVSVKIIDKPITTNWPIKPNIFINLVLALIFGIAIGIGFIYYFPEYDLGKYLIGLFFKKNNKTIFHNHLNNNFTKEEELNDRFEKRN
ncbi:MAG: GNVR domain-containing protein [bacterium]